MLSEREFPQQDVSKPEAEKKEKSLRFSQEVRRWAKRAIVGIPLLTGCSAERPIKEWTEHTFTPEPVTALSVEHQKMPPMILVDTESGEKIP